LKLMPGDGRPELKRAFEIGFLLFLPFLIIDLVASAAGGGVAAVQAHFFRTGRRLEPGRREPDPELRDLALLLRAFRFGPRRSLNCARSARSSTRLNLAAVFDAILRASAAVTGPRRDASR
jgi:hypothetical protein